MELKEQIVFMFLQWCGLAQRIDCDYEGKYLESEFARGVRSAVDEYLIKIVDTPPRTLKTWADKKMKEEYKIYKKYNNYAKKNPINIKFINDYFCGRASFFEWLSDAESDREDPVYLHSIADELGDEQHNYRGK